ncbi:quaternary ammonium compound efflux SMR transporter SugE [Qaidamihabitans albus]|uniref:quaternary ammonium compound efflux SMR transporter SugE n=1 Tax=Qaidamihabitans albus TaxID=2795733 RepID=UPI0018F27715|nr:quaternary ammonium compound efflux SMR transporter SugE [Qaidamihabitans albus]
MAWAVLLVAALLELVWALALKQADGFSRLWPSVLGVGAAAVSFVLLTFALRSLPVGTAYAVWVGVGAFGVAVLGIVALGESASLPRLGFLALILAGVIGLRLVED